MRKKEKRHSQQQGAALVELAIVAPILFLIAIGFWDLTIVPITRIWQYSSVGQFSRAIDSPPIQATVDTSTSSNPLTLAPLSNSILSNTYLPDMVNRLEFMLSNIGSGSGVMPHGVALQLHFFDISENTNSIGTPGYPTADLLALNNPFFTLPTSAQCFGSSQLTFQSDFNAYVSNIIQKIMNAEPEDLPPFGTKLFKVPFYNTATNAVEFIDSYIGKKPLLFIATCSRPFRFLSSDPIVTYHTLFFDNEVKFS